MRFDIVEIAVTTLLALALGFVFALWLRDTTASEYRSEAVKRNAAEWVVDPATGETTFTWKPVP